MPTNRSERDPETQAAWQGRRERLGARLRELRLERGLTQESLALESGVSRNQIVAVEWGKSSLVVERLFDLAAVLDVDVRELLTEPKSAPTRIVHRGGSRPQETD